MQIKNSLFVGKEFLNIEGRELKHIGTINYYAPITTHKISLDRMKFVSVDLETDHKTAELKLIGAYDGAEYKKYYKEDFVYTLFNLVKHCENTNANLIYWSRLDPAVLYKQLLLMINEQEQKESLQRYQRIDGELDRATKEWITPPLAKCTLSTGRFEFGILKSIRSCLLFYYIDLQSPDKKLYTVWAYDIKPFYLMGLEKVGKIYLPWYSKIDKQAHLPDWKEYETNLILQEKVDLSNFYDCKACYCLADIIQDDFYNSFKWYPTSLISPGSLTRSCYQAMISNKYGLKEAIEDFDPNGEIADETQIIKTIKSKIMDDLKSIAIVNFYDEWKKQLGDNDFKDFLCMISECYKGARIESFMNGYAKKGYTIDIASAYVAEIVKLKDLRGSKVYKGIGTPKPIENAYVLCRGLIHTGKEKGIEYHTILTKHPENKALNICAIGDFNASYYIEEREAMIKNGATFENEEWYVIQTTGNLSVLAEIELTLFDNRMELYKKGDLRERLIKTMMVSGYGVAYEAIMTYLMENAEILAQGFRAGEFFNDLSAGRITMGTRLMNYNACRDIIENGGEIVSIMTDGIVVIGELDTLPPEYWKEEKTLGYYEKPEEIRNIINLGAGRYEYSKFNKKTGLYDKFVAKTRGLQIEDVLSPDGLVLNVFKWENLLKQIKDKDQNKIRVNVRTLITPGVVGNSNTWKVKDMGLIASETRDIEIVVGKQKRIMPKIDYSMLKSKMFKTKPIEIKLQTFGNDELQDYTLPVFRKLVGEKSYLSREDKTKMKNDKASKKYYEKNKVEKKEKYNSKYALLRKRGLSCEDSKRMAGWKTNKIYDWLKNH